MIGMKICENGNLKQSPVFSFDSFLLSFSGEWSVKATPEGGGPADRVSATVQVWVAAGEKYFCNG